MNTRYSTPPMQSIFKTDWPFVTAVVLTVICFGCYKVYSPKEFASIPFGIPADSIAKDDLMICREFTHDKFCVIRITPEDSQHLIKIVELSLKHLPPNIAVWVEGGARYTPCPDSTALLVLTDNPDFNVIPLLPESSRIATALYSEKSQAFRIASVVFLLIAAGLLQYAIRS